MFDVFISTPTEGDYLGEANLTYTEALALVRLFIPDAIGEADNKFAQGTTFRDGRTTARIIRVFDPNKEARHLYRRMVSLRHPGLIFAGLVQPVGPTIPLVETQGKWIAGLLSGKMSLPDSRGMEAEVEAHLKEQKKTFLDSVRYVLEVDYRTCSTQMKQDLRNGAAGIN